MVKKRDMVCCCCGAYAGRYQQHWGRDKGFGLCENCIDFVARSISLDEFKSCYGEPGKHYARLPARFAEGEPA